MPTFRQDTKLGTKVPLIKTDDLNDKLITTDKLANGSVTNPKLAPESVTQDKFDKQLLEIFQAAAGLPEDLIKTIQDVDDTLKDQQAQISSNDGDISTLKSQTKQIKDTVDGIAVSGGASIASAVSYDNTTSGLKAMNTQNAIDELVEKKFDKSSIAQELGDSEDKVVSQFALPFRVEESEEFLYLIKDGEDHVLFGIQQDGSVEWQVGIPSPIRRKIQEIISQSQQDKIDLSDALNAAKNELNAALQAYKQTTDAAITSLQDTKVDKEEGKSLIDDEVKAHFEVIENDEWFNAMVDEENHILFGIKRDTGKPYFPLNEMYHVEQNEEYFALWLDAEDHILMGIRRDGQIVGEIHAVTALKEVVSSLQSEVDNLKESISTIDSSLQELLSVISIQENHEFMAVETDADGRILASTNADGSHYAYNLKSETIPEEFSHIEDPEGRMSMETDAEQKILAYRDKDGVKHEHELDAKTIHVSNLDLKDSSVNDIQSALIANGFNVKTPIDWSESSFIQIPEPRFAIINITNIDSMPTTKTQNKKAFLEFWDMQGNYFNKHAILNAQGNSSLGFIKKNVAIDLCDDEWIGDETPKVRIGNWVSQDSFHMKAYYTDFFRGVGAVSYKLYDQIVRTRGNMYDRPWKKALLDMSKIGTTTKSLGNPYVGDYELLTDTGARCFPDGFPVAVYLNGEFYGIFSFQLKKHRDNYHMDKSTAEHVHLDGTINYNILWNGNIVWGEGNNGFEVRNPKNLYAIGGNKYDADIKQEEIAGEDEVNTWIAAGKLPDGTAISSKIKKNLQMTAKVKKYIQDFANTINIIKTAASTYEASSKTEEDLKAFKAVFEKYYDAENLIDYIIVSDLIKNSDGFNKNWQWFTYDGIKWWVGLYDCDMSFGGDASGKHITNILSAHLNTSTNMPNGYVVKYYATELNARYKYLSDKGITSADNIFSLLQDWCMRIGTDFFKEEYKKWADSPCIADSIVRSEYWESVLDDSGNPQTDTSETFDATHIYNVGDVVSFGLNAQMGYFKYKCIKATSALSTNTPHTVSSCSPISAFKHCDNIYRVQKWIEQNTSNMDKVYSYTRNN